MKLIFFTLLQIHLFSFSVFAQTNPVHEEQFVSIGGIKQWVTIQSEDTTKPVVLFLHGGPGSVMSPYQHVYGDWGNEFVLVNWDQRGAGRTFGRNAPSDINEDYWIENPLTIEQMVADGIELSEHLIKRLGKEKIILIGTSWGSILGAEMALKRPDLFYAYLGHSQIVNFTDNLQSAYQEVSRLAKDADDQESVGKLKALGVPPYDDAKKSGQFFRIVKKYEKERSIPAPDTWWKVASEYDNEVDGQHRYDGDDYSFINFVGHKALGIEPMGASVDFMKAGLEFEIPVYLIQGKWDILTSKEITKAYFDSIKTPEKEYFLIADAAHGHNQSVVDMQYKIVKEYVVPLIK